MLKSFLKIFATYCVAILISTSSLAGMNDNDKSKAWDCVGIYMANYFLPSGEEFEYSMKEKSISTVKVLKAYAIEIGIPEKDWDEGVIAPLVFTILSAILIYGLSDKIYI